MEITTTLKRGIPILEPRGKIAGPGISALREKLALWIDDANTPYLLIDLTEIRKVDSSALGMLLNAHINASQKGTCIGLINVGKHIKNLLVLTRLANVFQCFQTADAAVLAFAPTAQWINGVSKQLPMASP